MALTFIRGLRRLEAGNSNVSQDLPNGIKSYGIVNNESHLKEDTLNYMVFHGDGRAKLPENLIENDLVLTTYATLVADCKGPAVLQRIAWFRVVLDEDKAALSSRLMKLANCWISPLDSKSNLATISSFRNAPRATQMVFDWYTDSKPARRSPLSVEVSSLRAILSTVHIPEICTGSFERREL